MRDAIFEIAKHIVEVDYKDIPSKAIELAKMDILDTLGVTIAATSIAPGCKELSELVRESKGEGESTIIGYTDKVPSYMAAFVNGALAHSLNYDDLDDVNLVHIGCSIFPAALAMAERLGKISGEKFVTAYVLGLDLECRLGRSLILVKEPRDWVLYGWQLSQIFGYFGATAVAGKLLGLDSRQLLNAFGIVYSQAAGNQQAQIDAGSYKGLYASYPAKSGVLSSLMAKKGIKAANDILEGKAGLYNVYFQGEYNSISLITDLGKSYQGPGFYIYPCCSYAHPYVELALRVLDENEIESEEIKAITVFVGPKSKILCEPLQLKRNPRMMPEAQLSIPFTVATALTKGKPCLKHFTNEYIKDDEILFLSNKVNWEPDRDCDAQIGTGAHNARIEIKLSNNRNLQLEQQGFRTGHAERPASKKEIIKKFKECCSYSIKPIDENREEEIIRVIDRIEELEDISNIAQLVS